MRAIACAWQLSSFLWHPATSSPKKRGPTVEPTAGRRRTFWPRVSVRDGDPGARGSAGSGKFLKTPEGEVVVTPEDLQSVPGPIFWVILS